MYVNDDSSHIHCLKFVYSIHTADGIFEFSVSTGQCSAYHFLFTFYTNYGCISYCLSDILLSRPVQTFFFRSR